MANIIKFGANIQDHFSMSNGATDVFLNVIILSGSELAQTAGEKQLIVWLAERDQVVGRGTVGFDIINMPWSKSGFDEEKKFLLKVIEAARTKQGWNKLDYAPNEEIITYLLDAFQALIVKMTAEDVQEKARIEWLESAEAEHPINCGFPRCETHGALLGIWGCQICNS